MADSFKIVFSLQASHSYFENGICNCFQYVFAGKTRELAERYKLYLVPVTSGFELYASTSQSILELLQYISNTTAEVYFEFDITTSYSGFYLFTALPLNWTGQVMFSSQSENNVKQGDAVQLTGSLSELEASSKIASLKIYFEDLLESIEKVDFARFKIDFESRKTQWHYYIINSSKLPLDQLEITSTSEISFEGPKSTIIPNGQKALLFNSGATLIPLSEITHYTFNLTNAPPQDTNALKKVTSSKPVFLGLPNPNPENMDMIVKNGKNIATSPMYAYI